MQPEAGLKPAVLVNCIGASFPASIDELSSFDGFGAPLVARRGTACLPSSAVCGIRLWCPQFARKMGLDPSYHVICLVAV